MKYVEGEYSLKMIPETEKNIVYLGEKLPHLGRSEAVNVGILTCWLCGRRYVPAMGIHTCGPFVGPLSFDPTV